LDFCYQMMDKFSLVYIAAEYHIVPGFILW